MGHASRCIPIIERLRHQGHDLVLASDGAAGSLLRLEYPSLPYVELPSYRISYPSGNFFWHWLRKAPTIIRAIYEERQKLKKIINQYKIEVVISDNRYGMYHPETRNIIITHQLNFTLPHILSETLSRNIIARIERFDECWIPDHLPPHNLSGALSQASISIPKVYIGILSRMTKLDIPKKYQVAVMLSGPEPNRTQLQSELISFFSNTSYTMVFLLGQPHQATASILPIRAEVFAHLPTQEINRILCQSDIIVSRSGYSSLMDYYKLQKKAILIPTPNQPEQVYLAERHGRKKQFYVPRNDLRDLEHGIELLNANEPAFRIYNGFNLPSL